VPEQTTSATEASVVVIDGNPQPASRTATVGRLLGERLAALVGVEADQVDVVSLSGLGPALLRWGDESVAGAKAQVLGATVVVVATPTYKATYTGLLKLFLDRFDAGVEIGARIPTKGLYVWGDQIDAPDAVLDAWLATEADVVRRQLR